MEIRRNENKYNSLLFEDLCAGDVFITNVSDETNDKFYMKISAIDTNHGRYDTISYNAITLSSGKSIPFRTDIEVKKVNCYLMINE